MIKWTIAYKIATNLSLKSKWHKSSMLSRRTDAGFGLVEAFTSACFIIVAVIVSLDTWFMISGTRITDAACRDAARAASEAGDATTASNAACAVVQSYAQMGSQYISSPTVTVTYAANATPPTVTVTTTTTVNPILPLTVFGQSFLGGGVVCSQQYCFPIVVTTAGANANNLPAPGSVTITSN